jgi:hypothetical protein
MFGENFGFDYYQQRHAELVEAAERARLVHCLEAARRAEECERRRAALYRRMLAATGGQLVRLGTRMQQGGLSAG